MYLKGQEVEGAYDKFDYEFCGGDLPNPVISDGPRLVMVFSSGELQGRGFKVSKNIGFSHHFDFFFEILNLILIGQNFH